MIKKEEWQIKRLGEVCEILDNLRRPVTKKDRLKGIYPYYGATGIQDYVDNFIFDGSFVLVGEDGARWGANEKCAFIVKGKCWVNNHAHVLKINKNTLDEWVVYFLNFKDLDEYISGAVIRKLNQAALRGIHIPVPPIPIQHQIVSELNVLSDIIIKKKQQLEELDKLAQATFYDMFGDPVSNEKGWVTKKLGEVCSKITDGKHGDCVDESESGCYFISAKDINGRKIKTENARQITYSDFIETNNRTRLSVNDVVVVNTGATIGKTAIANQEDVNKRLTFQKSVAIITTDSKMLDFNFLELYIHLNRNEIYKEASGSAQKNWLLSQMRNYEILLPPLKIQIEFAKLIEKIEKQKELINKSIYDVQQLFDYTMDKYFN